jgi:hypothetical protein
MRTSCDGLACDHARHAGQVDTRSLLDEVGAKAERDAGGRRRRFKAYQHESKARIFARGRAFACKRNPALLQRALPFEGDIHGRGGELGLADNLDLRHAGEIDGKPALASA